MHQKNLIIRAAQYASICHKGQLRKYLDPPEQYIMHPMRVAGRVTMLPNTTDEMVAAAWLHDVCEDCLIHTDTVTDLVGPTASYYVHQLTNPKDTNLSRAKRKERDRSRLAKTCKEVKQIKLIDRIDNISQMANAPSDFVWLYLEETGLLNDVLADADQDLAEELMSWCDWLAHQHTDHPVKKE